MKKEKVRARYIIGVGRAAPPLIPLIAKNMGIDAIVPEYAPFANAIGAAVARPTLTLDLNIDTARGEYLAAEEGIIGKICSKNLNQKDAEQLARKLLVERTKRLGISEYAEDAEILYNEVFNIVHRWSNVGRLMNIRMEIQAGILPTWRC
ncbi:MAG: hypothetical protein MUO26_15880 [Methanotrichaceae archaeon]|nr:hypothetical protein [Methanotrichaceae archaeon]